MTAPKKPAKAKLTALDAPPLELTPEEKRLLTLFRALKIDSRVFIESAAKRIAAREALSAGPSLRLITGGRP